GTRRNLVSLAEIAAEAEAALERMAKAAEADLVTWEDGAPLLARDRLHLYDSAVTSRVLRNLLRRFGVVPGRMGTRRALQFITGAESGRVMPLSDRLQIEIEFDRARLSTTRPPGPADRGFQIDSADAAGEASIRIGGVDYRIRYGRSERGDFPEDSWTFRADVTSLAFPLRVRRWEDGDRMRTQSGRRSLKKIFLERRVPRSRRRRLPLLVDASGEVLWVAGLPPDRPGGGGVPHDPFIVRVLHA